MRAKEPSRSILDGFGRENGTFYYVLAGKLFTKCAVLRVLWWHICILRDRAENVERRFFSGLTLKKWIFSIGDCGYMYSLFLRVECHFLKSIFRCSRLARQRSFRPGQTAWHCRDVASSMLLWGLQITESGLRYQLYLQTASIDIRFVALTILILCSCQIYCNYVTNFSSIYFNIRIIFTEQCIFNAVFVVVT
jgi:hypothetical protein